MEEPTSKENLKFLRLMKEVRMDFHKKYRFENVNAYGGYYNDSIKMMQSEDLKAFDLNLEPESIRKSYKGPFGDSLLLARRLNLAGVQSISMNLGNWDHHNNLWIDDNFPNQAKYLDQALAAFFDDMERHGQFKDTIVTINSEFGRTPIITPRKDVITIVKLSSVSSPVLVLKMVSSMAKQMIMPVR